MVDAADQPTAGQNELQVKQALPRGLCARTVKSPEENAGECLQEEREDDHRWQKPAAPGAIRYRPVAEFVSERRNSSAVIKPN